MEVEAIENVDSTQHESIETLEQDELTDQHLPEETMLDTTDAIRFAPGNNI